MTAVKICVLHDAACEEVPVGLRCAGCSGKSECQHRLADARNPVVKSGYICVDCGALFRAADHDTVKLISDEDIMVLAHRYATTYTHRTDPDEHAYGFVRNTLISFIRNVLAFSKS